jgi:hypothetical protein
MLLSAKKEVESAKTAKERADKLLDRVSKERDNKVAEVSKLEADRTKLEQRLKDKAYRLRLAVLTGRSSNNRIVAISLLLILRSFLDTH